jgi:hypothetical protein
MFFFGDFGSVRKFCYLFLGILEVNSESETVKNEPQKTAQKSRHFWTLASRKQGGNLLDCESQWYFNMSKNNCNYGWIFTVGRFRQKDSQRAPPTVLLILIGLAESTVVIMTKISLHSNYWENTLARHFSDGFLHFSFLTCSILMNIFLFPGILIKHIRRSFSFCLNQSIFLSELTRFTPNYDFGGNREKNYEMIVVRRSDWLTRIFTDHWVWIRVVKTH